MIRFIRKGGRVIPIKVSGMAKKVPQEIEHIHEVRKARKFAKTENMDTLGWAFWKYTKARAKNTGAKIAKRISRFKMKGKL